MVWNIIQKMMSDNKFSKERLTEEQMYMYIAQHLYTDEIKLDVYLLQLDIWHFSKSSARKWSEVNLSYNNSVNFQQKKRWGIYPKQTRTFFKYPKVSFQTQQTQHIEGSLSSKKASDIPLTKSTGRKLTRWAPTIVINGVMGPRTSWPKIHG